MLRIRLHDAVCVFGPVEVFPSNVVSFQTCQIRCTPADTFIYHIYMYICKQLDWEEKASQGKKVVGAVVTFVFLLAERHVFHKQTRLAAGKHRYELR